MHIVHVETGRHLYGGAQQVALLLRGLVGQGVRCTLVCAPDSAVRTAVDDDVMLAPLPVAGDLDVVFGLRLRSLLQQLRPDLVHIHSRRGADTWGGLAARSSGIPAVLSRRVDNPELPILGAAKYRLYDKVIAISGAIEAELMRQGLSQKKISLIHSAVDTEVCQPTWSKAEFDETFGLASDELTVACIGQLIPRKGQTVLLEAWAEVLQGYPRAQLLLFGQGRDEGALKQQVAKLGIESGVKFSGYRADLRAFLGHVDLIAHPAFREGLGVCLLEAQAAGVPVVASRAGGIVEAVVDGETGLLVEPGNARMLAQALASLLEDSQRRARLGAMGRQFVAQNFSVPAMVSGNLGVYANLVGNQ